MDASSTRIGWDRVAACSRAAALALGLLGLLAGCGAGESDAGLPVVSEPAPGASQTTPPAEQGTGSVSGVVTNVVDGDTIDVAGAGRIRVIGIDTPERGACGFESATLAMAALVNGREVALVPGAVDDVDRYGRLLRYVDVGAVDAGLSLIDDGWAIARYDSRDGYGRHPREDAYVAADRAAPDLGCYPDDEP